MRAAAECGLHTVEEVTLGSTGKSRQAAAAHEAVATSADGNQPVYADRFGFRRIAVLMTAAGEVQCLGLECELTQLTVCRLLASTLRQQRLCGLTSTTRLMAIPRLEC